MGRQTISLAVALLLLPWPPLSGAKGAKPGEEKVAPPGREALARAAYFLAEGLFEQGDYSLAAAQYALVVHLQPNFKSNRRCRIKAALCWFMLGDYERCLGRIDSILRDERLADVWDEAMMWYAACLYAQGKVWAAAERLSVLRASSGTEEVRACASYLLGWAWLVQGNDRDALRLFRSLKSVSGRVASLKGINLDALCDAVGHLRRFKRKSPALAAVLAAILPGAGHFYCNRYADGVVAFGLNAAFIAASVESFRKRVYAPGVIASSVELVWYSGTIYGAVNAANRFNKKRREKLLRGLRERFGDECRTLVHNLYD